MTETHSWLGKLVSGASCFWGKLVGGGQNVSGVFFCMGGHFVSGGFRLKCLFDGWFMARWLLSGGFLRGTFDRIPCVSVDQNWSLVTSSLPVPK